MWQSSNWPQESCFMVLFSTLPPFKGTDQLCSRLTSCLSFPLSLILPILSKPSFYLLFIFLLLFLFFCQSLQTNPCLSHFSRKKKKGERRNIFYKPQTRQIPNFFFSLVLIPFCGQSTWVKSSTVSQPSLEKLLFSVNPHEYRNTWLINTLRLTGVRWSALHRPFIPPHQRLREHSRRGVERM